MTMMQNRILAISMICLASSAAAWAQEVEKVTAAEALRAVMSRVAPEYPAMARQLKVSGETQLTALIDETGSVEKVSVVSGNPILTKAAAEAVRKWKFAPFSNNGKAHKALAPITVTFRM